MLRPKIAAGLGAGVLGLQVALAQGVDPSPLAEVADPAPAEAPQPLSPAQLAQQRFEEMLASGRYPAELPGVDPSKIAMVRVNPFYPTNAARDGITGVVTVQVLVDPDGTVANARVLAAEPRGVFEAAAIQSVYKWRFKPVELDGQLVGFQVRSNIRFELQKS